MSRNGGYSFRVLQAVADSTLHTIKVYQPFISAVIGPHVSNAVLWLAVSQSPRPLTETLGQTLGWQYSGHTSPDLDLTPAITTNRHGRHIPPEIQRNARTPFSELDIINLLVCSYMENLKNSYTNNQQSFLSKLLCFDKRGTESKVALIILVIHLGSYPGMRSGGGLWGWVLRGLITLPRRKKDTKEVLLIHLIRVFVLFLSPLLSFNLNWTVEDEKESVFGIWKTL